jgi:kynurenine formamidase
VSWFDLSQAYDNDMPVGGRLPSPHFEPDQFSMPGGDGRIAYSKLAFASHVGTHVDAPWHHLEDGTRLEDLALESFTGNGVVAHVNRVAGEAIQIDDVLGAGSVPGPGEMLLIRTGWGRYFESKDREHYVDAPWLSSELISWCVESGLRMVGTDTSTPEMPGSRRTPEYTMEAHHRLLGAGVLVAENLNLESVPPGRYEIFAFPLRLPGGDGAPARIVARSISSHD